MAARAGGAGYVADPARHHRKEWEFAQAVYGLRKLGCLCPEAVALGLASGPSRSSISWRDGSAPWWRPTSTRENSASTRRFPDAPDPEAFAPFSYHRDRLTVRRMDATRIDYGPESFDLVFCLSSFEHFGPRRVQRQSGRDPPGAPARGGGGPDDGGDPQRVGTPRGLFPPGRTARRPGPRRRLPARRRRLPLRHQPRDLRGPREASPRGRPPAAPDPAALADLLHLLRLFLEKPVPFGTPPERCAPRGAEPARRPAPLLRARLGDSSRGGLRPPVAEVHADLPRSRTPGMPRGRGRRRTDSGWSGWARTWLGPRGRPQCSTTAGPTCLETWAQARQQRWPSS